MPRTLSVAAVRDLDRRTTLECGIPERLLMEVAGYGTFRRVAARARSSGVLILAGRGNNAGDGYVVARFCASAGIPVRVLGVHDPLADSPEGAAAENARILPRYGITWEPIELTALAHALDQADVVLDALLGTGLKGSVRPPYSDIIPMVNRSRTPTVSADIPSGLCGNTGEPLGVAIEAIETVTYGAIKMGMTLGAGPDLCGEITVVPLPFPPGSMDS